MKLIKPITLAIITTVLSSTCALAANPTPQQALANMRKAYSSLRSLETSGTMVNAVTVDGKKQSANAKYNLAFQRPTKLRLEAGTGNKRRLAICDGKNVYMLLPGGKHYQRAPFKGGTKDLASLGGPGINTVALLAGVDFTKTVNKPKIVGQAKMSGADTYILQFTMGKQDAAIQKLWIGKRDWLVRKNELTATRTLQQKTESGVRKVKVSETSSTLVSSLKANAPIKSSTFVFKAPKGVTQFDPKKAMAERKQQVEKVGNALEGKPAPAVSLKDIKGQDVNLAEMKGKVVILNFWFSGQPASKAELSLLQKLYASQKSKGLEVVAISADPKPADVKKFASDQKLTFRVVTGDAKSLQPIGKAYRLIALPTTYIIDRNGKIVEHFVGVTKDSQLQGALKKAGL